MAKLVQDKGLILGRRARAIACPRVYIMLPAVDQKLPHLFRTCQGSARRCKTNYRFVETLVTLICPSFYFSQCKKFRSWCRQLVSGLPDGNPTRAAYDLNSSSAHSRMMFGRANPRKGDPARLQAGLANSGPRVTTADVYPASLCGLRCIVAASHDGFSRASTSTTPRHWPKPCLSRHQVREATE